MNRTRARAALPSVIGGRSGSDRITGAGDIGPCSAARRASAAAPTREWRGTVNLENR